MIRMEIGNLPDDPLDAAAAFHGDWLGKARAAPDDLLMVFPPAHHTHRRWRLAATQELARAAAPRRVNAVASDNKDAIDEAAAYLADAPGITGQYLPLG